ncbi:Hint domain-containing protein [uncultured Litoreibacter sp.]|uniref:Hint domain-containing protein n=1 Tax=uncultured Litoreibacter sp. TaxID=1392394 RepID=UPI00262A5800|nr:Hint domain-containing protein [uncultured Litoreibacter sp.]
MAERIWDMKTTGLGPGTQVDTTEGPVPVEWLSTTHRVLTRDRGPQPVLEVGQHILRPLDGAYVPLVTILPDAFGDDAPNHPLTLPPHHQVLQTTADIALQFGTDAALCRSGHLVDGQNVRCHHSGEAVAFYSVLTPDHDVIRANGIWVETTFATPDSELVRLDTLSPGIFAQLRLHDGGHISAYPCLEEWEGRMLARQRSRRRPWAFAQVA